MWALWETAWCAVVQVPVGAFWASAGTAAFTRRILCVRQRKAPLIENGELIHRRAPVVGDALPLPVILRNASQISFVAVSSLGNGRAS